MPQIKEPVSNKFNKIELKIQEIIFSSKSWIFYLNFCQNSRNLIFILNFHRFFYTSPFIWYISIHHVKYLDKPIKCLEMRAKIKSVWKIFLCIFRCIFTYMWKSDVFHIPQFWRKRFFGYFKSLFIKCPTHINILPQILYQKCMIIAIW